MSVGISDTIAALSTPAGESGIAVVRLSGADALSIVATIFVAKARGPRPAFEHHRIYHGFIVDKSGETIDEVMCAVMRGPDSFTGEDTVEISCHGNTLLVQRVLNEAFRLGARPAEAGEFTKRSFLNGKIDLIQAEAVADLIHARSELQRKVAQQQLAGGLSERINKLADEALELLGIVEANIDFIEDDIDTLESERWLETLEQHKSELDALLANAAFSKPFREGYSVVIAGPVNAGKSSLFNRLIGENRAIVTDIPGTTRDVLREPIVLDGLIFVMQDTAGLRGTNDHVESIGIDLAESVASDADIVLFVIDTSQPWPEDLPTRLSLLDPARSIVVMNKIDLPPQSPEERLRQGFPALRWARSSAETGDGLAELEKTLIETVGREHLDWIARERIVLNTRLINILAQTSERIGVLRENLDRGAPLEILALDAREVLHLYEKATGKRYTDDLLDTIFSRFCIGK